MLCALLTVAGLAPMRAGAAKALPDRPRIAAVETALPPMIDGRLDDPAWRDAALIEGLRQEIPVAFGVPSQRTEGRILDNADFVYFRVRAKGQPAWGEAKPRGLCESPLILNRMGWRCGCDAGASVVTT